MLRPSRSLATPASAALAILVLGSYLPAEGKPPACTDARFVASAPILAGDAGSPLGAFVTLADGQVTIGSGCGPARARLRGLRFGATRLRARWKRCGDLRRVRLRARIEVDETPCARLAGTLTARGGTRVAVAAARSRCGDGIVDAAAGERCDPPGADCTNQCRSTEKPPPPPPPCLDDPDGCPPPPANVWTWVPFDGAYCANGSTTGIGVNTGTPGGRLVIFLMGGGACWDGFTCYGVGSASNLSGYGADAFARDATGLLQTSLFDRTDVGNPFRDDTFVFVPYCTGDVHSGSNPAAVWDGRPTMHVGFENMTAFLPWIVATYPNPSRVLLSGASAGGFGALTNWWQTQEAFGDVRVDLLDDSGPTLPPPYTSEGLEQAWRAAWNLGAATPPGCTACADDLHALVPFYGTVFAGHRAALLAHTHDSVIGYFFAQPGSGVEAGLHALATLMAPYELWRHFYVTGSSHVLLFDPDVAQNGITLRTFLTQMVTDDPAWSSVAPP